MKKYLPVLMFVLLPIGMIDCSSDNVETINPDNILNDSVSIGMLSGDSSVEYVSLESLPEWLRSWISTFEAFAERQLSSESRRIVRSRPSRTEPSPPRPLKCMWNSRTEYQALQIISSMISLKVVSFTPEEIRPTIASSQ